MSTNTRVNQPSRQPTPSLLARTRCRESGQAVVEFALVMIILIPIVIGTLDLGRGIYAYNVLASAAREGARYGTTLAPSDSTHPNLTAIRQRMLQTAVLDLDANQISATCSPDCYQGSSLTVTVNYTFLPATPLFWQFPLTGRSTMVIEYPRP
ncbi:MAG: pilus assembly protein [Chloroflexi bacterium]|nr:pilus assembly protein [Chloroflexota bacterium]